ncbi:MAG: hypothetical protein R3C26_21930 [Calditrichia bacterium]
MIRLVDRHQRQQRKQNHPERQCVIEQSAVARQRDGEYRIQRDNAQNVNDRVGRAESTLSM